MGLQGKGTWLWASAHPVQRPLPSLGGPGSHTTHLALHPARQAPEQTAQRQEAAAQAGAGLQAQLGGGSWRHRDWNR